MNRRSMSGQGPIGGNMVCYGIHKDIIIGALVAGSCTCHLRVLSMIPGTLLKSHIRYLE